jgi:hypothetical protein
MFGGDVAYLCLAMRFPLDYRGDGDADGKNSAGVGDGEGFSDRVSLSRDETFVAGSTCSL